MTAIIEFKGISGTGEEILKHWIAEMVEDKDVDNESMLRYADSVRFEDNNIKKAEWDNCDGM